MASDRVLRRTYDEYNQLYFSGTLPRVPVVWRRLSKDLLARFSWREKGGIDGVLTLSPRLQISVHTWRMTLLHEMIHVKLCDHPSHSCNDYHGKAFIAEFRRLVSMGAFDNLI